MQSHITQLHLISRKKSRKILGLMSGTSLDGLDLALCEISGCGRETTIDLVAFMTIPYESDFVEDVKKIFSRKNGDIEMLTLLHGHIGMLHGKLVNQCLQSWKIPASQVDLIASHGQTIYHAPFSLHQRPGYGNATLQLGDGDNLAVATGIITLSDFRMKHIAAGGQGAPLAGYGDYLMFSHPEQNRILLNIGGISNFSWLPSSKNEVAHPFFTTDVGPGNTLMNVYSKLLFDTDFDDKGNIAASASVHQGMLNKLMDQPFFSLPAGKSIGPELFNIDYVQAAIQSIESNIEPHDLLATLNAFTARAIGQAIKNYIPIWGESALFISGGGWHNLTLIENLKRELPGIAISSTADLGMLPDAKEAMLFALLANECVAGEPWQTNQQNPFLRSVSMGKVSFPG